MSSAILALEDGSIWRGQAFGAPLTANGEVCFNTSMTGYQEILTDPSYRGQIVAMTYPLIGNTGINTLDVESDQPHVAGLIVRELSPIVSSWRSEETLASYLERHKIPGITGIDTRSLTLRLRTRELAARRCSTSEKISDAAAIDLAKKWSYLERDFVKEVTCKAKRLRLGSERQAQPQVDTHPGQTRAGREAPHRRGLPRKAPAGEIPDRRV